MRVLHLLPSTFFSGAENVICQIFDVMSSEKDLEMVYCSPDGKIRESLKQRNVPFLPLKAFRLRHIKKAIREFKPDIIHAHDILAAFMASRATRDIPIISHMHGNNILMRRVTYLSLIYKAAHKRLKHIFWVSKSAFEDYVFKSAVVDKSSLLYNIVNPETIVSKMRCDENTYNYDVCYIGRLTYPKHPQRLVKVLRGVVDLKPDIKICVAGSGDMAEETMALAKAADLDGNVDFLGFVSNPLKIINDSKVMIMTSRYEGTPMCVLEAMALGKPIVSTPVDGLMDIIKNDINGYLSNDDDELARRIVSIVEDECLFERLSEGVRSTSDRINDKNTYKNSILEVYNRFK